MDHAVELGEAFGLITGEPGSGKTTLINDVLANVDEEKLIIARLIGMHLVREELLRMVAFAFGLNVTTQDNISILAETREFLIEQKQVGRRAILIVDEAQTLSSATLEELRLLSNLEYNNVVLLQIFLVGQERLLEIVINPAMAQLHQRLIAACHLNPLNAEQTESYIKHRLILVGWKEDPRLHEDIFPLIHKHSRGVPRSINLLCNRLFSAGFIGRKHELNALDVQHTVEELRKESLLYSEREVAKELSRLPAYASQNTVFRTSHSNTTDQERSKESISFPKTSQRRRKASESKPTFPLPNQGIKAKRYENSNTLVVVTIGFLIGLSLALTLLAALNFQQSSNKTFLSQDGEGQNAKELQVTRASNRIVQDATFQPKSSNSDLENEKSQFSDGKSPTAERAPNEVATGEIQEWKTLTKSMDQHVAWMHRTQPDQQNQQNLPDALRGGEHSNVESRQPKIAVTVENESILESLSKKGSKHQNQNIHEIPKLLAEAERQRTAFKITKPQGDNASETYQRVLELEPTNKAANEGLTELLKYYLQWATYYKKEGLYESSLDFIYRGLTIQPNNAELLALKEQVQLSLYRTTE